MTYRFMADCHSHSDCSFDGTQPMVEMCERAAALSLSYYAVTDHCECDQYMGAPMFGGRRYFDVVRRAFGEMQQAQAHFPNLRLLRGIELGQPLQNLPAAEDALGGRDYDVVIGSLHNIAGRDDFYFFDADPPSPAELDELLGLYFKELLEMVEWGRFDTLAHITYPLRYLCRAGDSPSFAAYEEELSALFRRMIQKGIALEFNTSRLLRTDSPVLPDKEVFALYRALGGMRVTLGADAHRAGDIAQGIPEALGLLQSLGYTEFTVYQNRQPIQLPIEPMPAEERK